MTESQKKIRTEMRSMKIGNKDLRDLTLDELIDIKLYITRYKLERGEIS